MKKSIIILLAIACIFAAVSCKQDVETKQAYVWNSDGTKAGMTEWKFENQNSKYILKLSEREATKLYVKTYDQIKEEWPEDWVVFTGTATCTIYEKVITDTPALLEVSETEKITVTFNEVSDSWYESMLHAYDGTFEITWLTNYQYNPHNESGYSVKVNKDTTMKFDVCPESDGAPSALIGLGPWHK